MVAQDNVAERFDILQHLVVSGRAAPEPTEQRAVGYGRISKSSKTKLQGQHDDVADYCAERLHMPLSAWYEDDGKSGLSKKRQGFRDLLADVASGRVSHVVIFKADRLSRDDGELKSTILEMLHCGVEVHDTRLGQITEEVVPLLALLAYYEVRANSQRVTAKLRRLAEGGTKLGKSPVGYRHMTEADLKDGGDPTVILPGRYVPDEHDGPIVQQALRMAADPACSLYSARQYFNEGLHKTWDIQLFKKLLRNPYYCGHNVNFLRNVSLLLKKPELHKPHERIANEHQHPLISEDEWRRIQKRLQRGTASRRNPQNPGTCLSGLLRCARCGRRMRPHHPYPGQNSYVCQVCGFSRSEPKIKAALLKVLSAIDTDPRHGLVVMAESVDTAREQMQRQLDADRAALKDVTKARGTLVFQLAAGQVSQEDFEAAMEQAEAEREMLRARVAKLEATLANVARGADLSYVADHVDRLVLWCQERKGGEVPRLDIDEVRTRLQHVADAITIDKATNSLAVTWSPELAMVAGQQAASVALKARARGQNGAKNGDGGQ